MSQGSGESTAWREEVVRIDHAGDVYVRLHDPRRSLLLQVSPVGSRRHVLARSRFGDVSYNEVVGLSEAAAARLAGAYAARLDDLTSHVPTRFPHLAVAAGSGRASGSCRTTLTELWPSGMTLPAAVDELCLDPAGLQAFLLPEIGIDATPFAGFVLKSIGSTASGCRLEFEEQSSSQRVSIEVGEPGPDDTCFGAGRTVPVVVRHGDSDSHGDLMFEVASLCSHLVALIELKQSQVFAVHASDVNAAREVSTPSAAAHSSRPASALPTFDAEIHRFAVLSSGFTILRQALPPQEVAEIAAAVDRALAAMQAAAAAGREIAYTFYDKDTYLGTRCIYCWGDAGVRLIESDLVRSVADAVIGPHKLFDMSAHRALPAAHLGPARTEEWHRDIDVFDDSPRSVRYLWFFVPLNEFTAENGATWIVPGSQRLANSEIPRKGSPLERFPTRVQLTGSVGDVFVINPSALHTVGHNATEHSRSMVNLGVCHRSVQTLLDNWAIAGPGIQEHASQRLRHMLGAADESSSDPTWSVLPEGWQTSPRCVAADPSTRVFPPEQQGYQRSHRIRDD